MEKYTSDFITYQHKGLKPLDNSFLWQDDVLETRFCWAIKRTSVLRDTIETVRSVVDQVGFKEYSRIIERIAESIISILNTNIYPIHIIGVAFTGNHVRQLKLYYTLYIFKSEEDIMGIVNDNLAKEAIIAILDELSLDKQKSEVLRIIQIMQAKHQRVAGIGLNIEHQKKPGLKIYFEPLKENQQIPRSSSSMS